MWDNLLMNESKISNSSARVYPRALSFGTYIDTTEGNKSRLIAAGDSPLRIPSKQSKIDLRKFLVWGIYYIIQHSNRIRKE